MIFTAAAAWVATTIGVTSAFGVAAINLGVRVLASVVVSSLIGNRQQNPADPQSNGQQSPQITGSRIQLPVSTDNKLGVVYGEAFIKGCIIDAKISEDQKIMWYVLALTEVTDTGAISLGDPDSATNSNIFWGDKQLVFGDSDKTKVTSWITSNGDTDDKVNGYMNIYLYRKGSFVGDNTTIDAITLLSDSSIAASERWNGPRYTYAGASPTMANTAFVVIKLVYNENAGIIGLDQFTVKAINTLTKPGDVLLDYLTNIRYGCGVPYDSVDMGAITRLNSYSDELITYTPVGGGTATQPRYRINGPIITGQNCLQNLQSLVDACDSWLQWNESVAKWSIIPNRSYLDYTTYDELFLIDSSAITTGVNVSPVDLNATYNWIEAQFPNKKIEDNTDYTFVVLDTEDKNPNEPLNKLIIRLDQVNSSVQAKYLATRRLIQSREDLIVNFEMDYSGIQIDAGDVVRVRFPVYGWGPTNDNPANLDKLFRVDQVQEFKRENGVLGVNLSLIEYNNQVYENINIQDYEPAANTGLTDPTIVGTPAAPTISNILVESGTFSVNCIVPTPGQVIAMEFWYGSTPTIENNNYKLWDTQFNSTTPVYAPGQAESSNVVGFQPGQFYWAVRAITQSTKSAFSNATGQSWSPAQPATRKTVTDTASSAIIYEDTFNLWTDGTRGRCLSIDYTPTEDGSDLGGKDTNQIEVQFQANEYTAGSPDGLLLELWLGVLQFPTMYGIAKGNNGFVMSGGTNLLFTGAIIGSLPDPSARTYYQVALYNPSVLMVGVASNGPRYVSVGQNNIFFSDTGATESSWLVATIPSAASSTIFNEVIYAEGKFVAVGTGPNGAYICTSTDGQTWTERVNGGASGLIGIAYNGTSFLASGQSFAIGESSDGFTWTVGNIAGGSSVTLYGPSWSDALSEWITCGYAVSGGSYYSKIFKRTGFDWIETYTSSTPNTRLHSSANGTYDGYFYNFAVGSDGQVLFSFDGGDTWAVEPNFSTVGDYWQVRNIDNTFYFVGDGTTTYKYDIVDVSLQDVATFYTARIQALGSSPNSAYDVTVQPPQDRLTNNVLTTNTFRTGLYAQGVLTEYFILGGDLQNPISPSTVYAGRKSISLTEFKG
ncbi:MAG: hypothetical protein ACOVLB_03760 [Candidatus Nanopelagicus sp.]